MSKEQMLNEFESWCGSPCNTDQASKFAWNAWQAAWEIKQKEIDALRYAYQLDEELIGAIQKIITVLNSRPTSMEPT